MNLGGTIRLNRRGFCAILACLALFAFYVISTKRLQLNGTPTVRPTTIDRSISVRNVLSYAVKAAQHGGYEVVKYKDSAVVSNKGKTLEGINDSVTTADFKSHCVMSQIIREQFGTLKIISEEKTNCEPSAIIDTPLIQFPQDFVDEKLPTDELTVWIDPLDATKEYTEKLYQYVTTMVCLSHKGQPIVGVIHNPFTNSTAWAWVNKIKSNDLTTKIATVDDKKPKNIIISRSHKGDSVEPVILDALGDDTKIESAGGAGYKVLQVVNGTADAYVHLTAIKKWDLCAGNAILNALGGKMTTRTNDNIDYSNGDKVVNDKGLIASLYDHDWYIDKFNKIN